MDSEPSEKCQKIESVDRISHLPDPILGEILYYLPTKDAVATSILSTRWKNLFPYALNRIKLKLNDCSSQQNNILQFKSPSFVSFVDKLLNETLLHVPCIERISIICEKDHGDEKIVSWVRAAVRLNVVYLKLTANVVNTEALFECLNGCATLMELEFGTDYELLLPEEEFVLPNLKRLYLHTLVPRDHADSIHELIDGCPLLEDLSFGCCDFDAMSNLCIQSSTLKRLFIECNFRERECTVKIDAPNLEAFVYDGHSIANYVVGNFKSLHSASIGFNFFSKKHAANLSSFNVNRLAKLLRACSKTTRLCFSGNFIAVLHRASVKLPRFKNLTCLALGRMGSHGFSILAQLLKNAPSLQTLTFEEGFKNCQGGYARFESSLPRLLVCLKQCFKKVVIWYFKGEEDVIKLMEYFLKNGRALQEVIVYHVPTVDTSILNRLLMFPRRSQTCQILTRRVDDWSSVRHSSYSRNKWFNVPEALTNVSNFHMAA